MLPFVDQIVGARFIRARPDTKRMSGENLKSTKLQLQEQPVVSAIRGLVTCQE